MSLSDDGQHWAAITGDPATQTLWLTVDAERVRVLSPDDAFSAAPLQPWLTRELRDVLANTRAATSSGKAEVGAR